MREYVCKGCKIKFPEAELITTQTAGGSTFRYCSKCYEEKRKKEHFSEYVCELFGLKVPGAKLYTQRKNLLEDGFTDETIIEVLEYLYRVKKIEKKVASLGLITLKTAREARDYFSRLEFKKEEMDYKISKQETQIHYVSTRDSLVKNRKPEIINLDTLMKDW